MHQLTALIETTEVRRHSLQKSVNSIKNLVETVNNYLETINNIDLEAVTNWLNVKSIGNGG